MLQNQEAPLNNVLAKTFWAVMNQSNVSKAVANVLKDAPDGGDDFSRKTSIAFLLTKNESVRTWKRLF